MIWLRLLSIFKRDAKIQHELDRSKEIHERLDEEIYRLRATLDGEDGWFRQNESEHSDRKAD